jgi:hypothetical protein
LFVAFDTHHLPPQHDILPEVGPTGDPCHRVIAGLSRRQGRTFFQEQCTRPGAIQVCASDTCHRPIPPEELEQLAVTYQATQ